jgi:hypothetical protein
MFHLRYESYEIRQGFNFYPLDDGGSFGCQMLFWNVRIEARWSKRTKRFKFGIWLRERAELPKAEFVYVPGYTEFLEKCARQRFGNRPWKGVEPADKFTSEGFGG